MSRYDVAQTAGMGSVEAAALLPLAEAGSEPLGMTSALAHSSLAGDEVLGQGSGEQVEPRPLNTPAHAVALAASEQVGEAPVVQQAPEQGFGVQVVPRPWKTLPAAVQPAGVPIGMGEKVTVQVSELEQQAPTKAVQGLVGVQVVPTPRNALVTAQPAVVVVVQVPVPEQHAPSRAVQGLVGRQGVPAPRNVLVPVQEPGRVTVQVPVPEQHAPVPGHRLMPQTVPAPWNVLPDGQPARVVFEQAWVVLLQQAPSSAVQGLVGRQAVPTPRCVLVPVQLAGSAMVHVPVPEQQAPTPGQGLT